MWRNVVLLLVVLSQVEGKPVANTGKRQLKVQCIIKLFEIQCEGTDYYHHTSYGSPFT
jgi:hypothetical protein